MIGPRITARIGANVTTAVGTGVDELGGSVTILVPMAGQSEEVGEDTTSNLTGGWQATLEAQYANVQLYEQERASGDFSITYTNGPYSLRPRAAAPTRNMGIELSMGRTLDSPFPARWNITKYGLSGTSLAVNWLPTGTYPIGDPVNLFNHWLAWLDAAEATLGPIRVIVWMQGESDSTVQAQANAYQTNLAALLAAVRAHKAAWAGMKFVIVRISSQLPIGTYVYRDTVRTAQAAVVAADNGLSALVNTDDLALGGGSEYTADSLRILGQRVGPYVYNSVGLIAPATASFSDVANGLTVTFTDTSTDPNPILGGIASWAWNFGDNSTSATQNPVHTYAGNGTYTVKLTITTTDGRKASTSSNLTVSAPTWTIDATSNIAVPANSTEWSSFISGNGLSVATPTSLYLCQEASGSLADSIGAFTLTAVGVITYAQTQTGWTRKKWTVADGGNNHFQTTSASLPDCSTTSFAVLMFANVTSNPGGTRALMEYTGGIRANMTSTPHITETSATTATGTANPVPGVRPYFLIFNRTAGTQMWGNDQEVLTVNIGAAITGKQFNLGGQNSLSAPCGYLYAVRWDASNGEITKANMKALLGAMGWTIPWT